MENTKTFTQYKIMEQLRVFESFGRNNVKEAQRVMKKVVSLFEKIKHVSLTRKEKLAHIRTFFNYCNENSITFDEINNCIILDINKILLIKMTFNNRSLALSNIVKFGIATQWLITPSSKVLEQSSNSFKRVYELPIEEVLTCEIIGYTVEQFINDLKALPKDLQVFTYDEEIGDPYPVVSIDRGVYTDSKGVYIQSEYWSDL